MGVLAHLIYEYKKKLRGLALHTFSVSEREQVEAKLQHLHIDYMLQTVSPTKMNVFFGDSACVDVVRKIGSNKMLNEYSPEEDFMLGIMLGYDRVQQCERYLGYSNRKKDKNKNVKLYIGEKTKLACV